jgi:hypothetical protein
VSTIFCSSTLFRARAPETMCDSVSMFNGCSSAWTRLQLNAVLTLQETFSVFLVRRRFLSPQAAAASKRRSQPTYPIANCLVGERGALQQLRMGVVPATFRRTTIDSRPACGP